MIEVKTQPSVVKTLAPKSDQIRVQTTRRTSLVALAVALAALGTGVATAATGSHAAAPVVTARTVSATGSTAARTPLAQGAKAASAYRSLVTRSQARTSSSSSGATTGSARRVDTPVPARAALVPSSSAFVVTCGTNLCLNGKIFPLKMASVLGIDSHRSATVAMAKVAGLNTIRLVNMLNENGPVSGAYDEATWRNVDADIAAARAAGLHVELDLSSYRNLLFNHGTNPYTQDWEPFLKFVADRVNTVDGLTYADDPTIALVAFAGEIAPPSYGTNTVHATSTQILDFFTRTFAEWHTLAPHQLRTTGGQLFVADPYAGISWKQLMLLPGDDVCSNHVYSQTDVSTGMGNMAAWCGGNRPWIVEEYGADQSVGDAARAAFFKQVNTRAKALGAAGTGFWNLGPELLPGSHDVNSGLPQTWSAVESEL